MKEVEMEKDTAVPASALRAALKATTERLSAELTQATHQAPAWSDFEWRAAMAVSVMHGVSALLANRLQWAGPPAWQAFLAEQAEQGRRRERKVRSLLECLHHAARDAGLPLLAMKGSALLNLSIYAEGERPMSDVDLLAQPVDLAESGRLILAAGYAVGITKQRHIAYEPLQQAADRAFGEHEHNPIKIELHEAVREPLPLREVDITAGLLSPGAKPGLNPYSSLAALMRHLLMHAAGNLCVRSVRLIQLHDIAQLAERMSTADWNEALAPANDGRAAWWALPVLTLTQQLFPLQFPKPMTARLTPSIVAASAACPPWLRRACGGWQLADVSLSRLDIPLLPGIEWSHGPADALGLAWRRLHPPEQAATAMMLQGQHSLASSDWTRRPHWRKALSFVLGAQPRAQTLYSMHRALNYRPANSA
ncbi:nucleotidyltransferase family protein [Paucibacter sp. DJ2R-2]|uniref:nucleotidyltransferase family protein n=1 Tax=Paucibacter sp. DJ2R-2 TaxID=2893558 RepID=UPI0021E3A99C|nr:nucleotidyltransferase family protein [Paucibacter sp. DJ2R-2]MCV2438634.1 nucleotidyltransferase family protein [Paucibacter sp. DJ2R-2]